ncbi:MAG: hypothetical protein LQ347_006152, partial [Umbilicaria vellea]
EESDKLRAVESGWILFAMFFLGRLESRFENFLVNPRLDKPRRGGLLEVLVALDLIRGVFDKG